MWYKADWFGHPMKLELTLAGLLVKLANHYTTRGAHPRYGTVRLYASRKERERGLASIQDSVDASIQLLEDNIHKHRGKPITAIRNNTDNTSINRTKITRKKWEEKQLYRNFNRQTNEISHTQKNWIWLKKGNLKRETWSLLIATQNNAIRTNYIKARIDKTQQR